VFLIQLTLNLEPLYGIVMAVIIFRQHEKMDVNFYIGTALILSAVGSYPLIRMRMKSKEERLAKEQADR
jgi:drug/metabolite transporter (DMT)-like permease